MVWPLGWSRSAGRYGGWAAGPRGRSRGGGAGDRFPSGPIKSLMVPEVAVELLSVADARAADSLDDGVSRVEVRAVGMDGGYIWCLPLVVMTRGGAGERRGVCDSLVAGVGDADRGGETAGSSR